MVCVYAEVSIDVKYTYSAPPPTHTHDQSAAAESCEEVAASKGYHALRGLAQDIMYR